MRVAVSIIAMALTGLLSTQPAQALSLEESAAFQTALIAHVDANTRDGLYHVKNTETGETVTLYPANLHPKILDFGRFVVLCADFTDKTGTRVEIDFIADAATGAPIIREAVIGKRKRLIARLIAEHGNPK